MFRSTCFCIGFICLGFFNGVIAQSSETLELGGLEKEVEIRVDKWGIAHIYAQTEADLFYAQGFSAARDRLFQFEIWRRQATGTVAEILGERELKRDIGTRLFQFRGNMHQEMQYYHPHGAKIISSFVRGVNAYIKYTESHPEELPMEFELLGIKPQYWTHEVVISRHQGLLGNITRELNYARTVHTIGPELTQELVDFHPGKPDLNLDSALQRERLFDPILELYEAYRRPIRFRPEDLVASVRAEQDEYKDLAAQFDMQTDQAKADELNDIGSNNWVLSGKMTAKGHTIMANDPHRSLAVPSLRYAVHLVGPGWNVMGGGEPEIPGISIGHNEYGAWGLTVFRTDAEDLYVYELNPENENQYRYLDQWEDMRIIPDTISVKDGEDVMVQHRYTRHGPVVYVDSEHRIAYAVRAGWMEIGGSPYLASLRMDQAKNWEEFREACNYSHIPGENMIWADKEGNIGWQAVGIAPIRPNWSGLLPVPGDGRYEWAGYLPIKAKPHTLNPSEGYFSTANQHVTPPDYPYRNALGYEWSDYFRGNRLKEVLGSGRQHSMAEMMRLQTDYLSIPARTLVPLLKELPHSNPDIDVYRRQLLDWDFRLEKHSITAGIYIAWEKRLIQEVYERLVPESARSYLRSLPLRKVIDALIIADPALGENPVWDRDELLLKSLTGAIADLQKKLGKDVSKWQYGQASYKHVLFRHPLSPAVNANVRQQLEVGPLTRGGNSHTLGNTGGNDNQTHGATFRIIVDTGDWDRTLGMNSPGQSGNPMNKHYKDLFAMWAKDQFFPFLYTRSKVEKATEHIWILR